MFYHSRPERLARYNCSSLLGSFVNKVCQYGPIKLSWRTFTHTFCKLDHFIKSSNICFITEKRSSLQKDLVKQKSFMRLPPVYFDYSSYFLSLLCFEDKLNLGRACKHNLRKCIQLHAFTSPSAPVFMTSRRNRCK
jgi:hypothetical protein